MKYCLALDLDGTLLNSLGRQQIVLDSILKNYGLSINTNNLISFKSHGYSNIDFLKKSNIPNYLISKIQKAWVSQIEKEEYLKFDALYDDTTLSLKKLSNCFDLLLVTSRNNKNNALKQLNELGIIQHFLRVFVIKPGKYASEEKANAIHQFKIYAFIGDTEIDQIAANILKVPFFALNRGQRSKQYWDNLKIKSFNKLKNIVDIIIKNNKI